MENFIDFQKELKRIFARADKPKTVETVKAKPEVFKERAFNIHKRSLPVGIDKVVISGIKTYAEAERIIAKTTDYWGKPKFASRSYEDDTTNTKTIIYYDILPDDAKPRERSVYFNPRPFVIELS